MTAMTDSPRFDKPAPFTLAVVGLGLIGGSFAAALREQGAVSRILGVTRQPETGQRAVALGLVDEIVDAPTAAARADMVMLATPVGGMAAVMASMRNHLRPAAVLTDAGSTKGNVIAAARAVVAGQLAGGVLSVVKHIPGHGRGTSDSHHDLPTVTMDRATLEGTDFAVFKALRDVPLGMTAHVVYSAIAPEVPATTSPILHRVIRDDIGFDGLLMTDDLSINALPGDISTRARDSMRAGCDVVLHCNGDRAEMAAVVDATGTLLPKAYDRAQAALALRQPPAALDISAVEADLEALLNG